MKNKNMNVVERVVAPTPKWFKILALLELLWLLLEVQSLLLLLRCQSD